MFSVGCSRHSSKQSHAGAAFPKAPQCEQEDEVIFTALQAPEPGVLLAPKRALEEVVDPKGSSFVQGLHNTTNCRRCRKDYKPVACAGVAPRSTGFCPGQLALLIVTAVCSQSFVDFSALAAPTNKVFPSTTTTPTETRGQNITAIVAESKAMSLLCDAPKSTTGPNVIAQVAEFESKGSLNDVWGSARVSFATPYLQNPSTNFGEFGDDQISFKQVGLQGGQNTGRKMPRRKARERAESVAQRNASAVLERLSADAVAERSVVRYGMLVPWVPRGPE